MVKLQYLEANFALIGLSHWVPAPSEIWLFSVCNNDYTTEVYVGFPRERIVEPSRVTLRPDPVHLHSLTKRRSKL